MRTMKDTCILTRTRQHDILKTNIVFIKLSVRNDQHIQTFKITTTQSGPFIIFDQRDMHPGEEVCICYFSFSSLNLERPTAGLAPEEKFHSSRKRYLPPEHCLP